MAAGSEGGGKDFHSSDRKQSSHYILRMERKAYLKRGPDNGLLHRAAKVRLDEDLTCENSLSKDNFLRSKPAFERFCFILCSVQKMILSPELGHNSHIFMMHTEVDFGITPKYTPINFQGRAGCLGYCSWPERHSLALGLLTLMRKTKRCIGNHSLSLDLLDVSHSLIINKGSFQS